jgi:hypothetical protein
LRRLHPFALGSITAAVVVGVAAGPVVLNLRAIVVLALLMAGGAAIAALVCWRWPGLSAPAWKLWPTMTLTNPMFVVGVIWTIDRFECVLSRARSWDCMFADFGPILAGLCLLPPIGGFVWRRLGAFLAGSAGSATKKRAEGS